MYPIFLHESNSTQLQRRIAIFCFTSSTSCIYKYIWTHTLSQYPIFLSCIKLPDTEFILLYFFRLIKMHFKLNFQHNFVRFGN